MLLPVVLFIPFIASFWIYCLVDAVRTPREDCRGLSKPAWIAVIALACPFGAVAWFGARHPVRGYAPRNRAARYGTGGAPGFPRYGRQRPARHPDGWDVPGRGGSHPDARSRRPPRPTDPGMFGRGMFGPGVTGPGMFGPGVTSPGMFGRGTFSTGATSPGMFGPGVTSPGMFGRGVTGPGGSGGPEGSGALGPRFRGNGPQGAGRYGPRHNARRRKTRGSWLCRLTRKPISRGAAKPAWRAYPGGPIGPDDDPEFLRSLDRVIRGTRHPGDDPGQPGTEQP